MNLATLMLSLKVVSLAFAWIGLFFASIVAAGLTMVLLPPALTLTTIVRTLSLRRVLYAMALTPATALVLANHFVMGKKQLEPLKPTAKQWRTIFVFSTLYWTGMVYLVIRALSPALGTILF